VTIRKELLISNEKYTQRDIIEKLSVIKLQKIGSHMKKLQPTDNKSITKGQKEYLFDFNNKLVLNEEREFSSGYYDI